MRFRVEEEEWHDNGPTGPVQSDKAKQRLQELRERQLANGGMELGDAVVEFPVDEYVAPYSIIVSRHPPLPFHGVQIGTNHALWATGFYVHGWLGSRIMVVASHQKRRAIGCTNIADNRMNMMNASVCTLSMPSNPSV